MQLLLRGFFSRIIFTAITFLISLLIAKLAGASQFGTLSLMIVNATFIYIFTGLGTDAAIVWHGIERKNYGRNKVFSFTIITAAIQLLFFYIIAILGFLFLGHTLLGGSFGLNLFFAEIIYFTGLVMIEKFTSLYYSQHEAGLCNRILAVVSFILLVTGVLVWIIKPRYIGDHAIWVYSLFVFIPSVILFFSFYLKYKPSVERISDDEYRSFSAFSAIVLITNIIQFIAFRADYWIISLYYDHGEVGIYAQASKFAQLLWIIPGILAGLIIPALKNEQNKLREQDFLSATRITFYSHLLVALLVVMFAFIIYLVFLPGEYFNGFYSLLVMLPGYLLFTITTMLAAYFSAHRLLKVNLYGSVLCCLLILALDLVLIPLFNYRGAAMANLIAYSVTTFYFIYRSGSLIGFSAKDVFALSKSDFAIFSSKILRSDIEKA